MNHNRGEAFTPLPCSETKAMQTGDDDACQRMTGKMGLKGVIEQRLRQRHTWERFLTYRAGRWNLCWERRPQTGPREVGHLLRAARAGCNPGFCRCCILRSGWPAWRSQCAKCSKSCICSGHPKTLMKESEQERWRMRARQCTTFVILWQGWKRIRIITSSA